MTNTTKASAKTKPVQKKSLDDAFGGDEETQTLSINQSFAKRFKHNKERDELQRLQSRFDGDAEDDDSESEEEDEEDDIDQGFDVDFLQTLSKIKRKDPVIYQQDTHFFPEEEDDEDEDQEGELSEDKKKKKKVTKPVFLKDVLARELLEDGPEGAGAEEDQARRRKEMGKKSYAEEQREARDAFLGALEADDSEEEEEEEKDDGHLLLRKKKKTPEELAREKKEDSRIAELVDAKQREKDAQRVLDDYFGKVEDLDRNDRFLRDYIVNKGWIDKEEGESEDDAGGGGLEEDEEDERALDEQDHFEAKYNFRFEEPGSERIVPHPRVQEETVRKDTSKRKRERASKKDRLEEAKKEKKEQLMRLKALKRAELDKKLQLIREVAGKEDLNLSQQDIEEDFDGEEHERRMAEVFGSEYYEDVEEMEDPEELEKPQFGDLEEELAQVLGADSTGFDSARKKNKKNEMKKKREDEDEEESDDDEESEEEEEEGKAEQGDEEEEDGGGRQRIGKRAAKRLRKEVEKHIDEYYKLDYEGLAAGMPCRFKYRQVNPKKYKLSTTDILGRSDKELNQVISLKKLAPYRDGRYDKFTPLASLSTASNNAEGTSKPRSVKQDKKDIPTSTSTNTEELKASRLLSYALPKIGKTKSTTALPKKSEKKKKKLKH